MAKISRYILVFTAIIGFAIVLPKLYWMAFSKPDNPPFIMYSCVDNEFMIRRSNDGITWEDGKGNSLNGEEFDEKLPLMYARQLIISNNMPDSLNGVALNFNKINQTNSSLIIRPRNVNAPKPELFPLFESESNKVQLILPKDFFRITWRMEFIDAETNKILEEKSRMFSADLYNKGFVFPAKSINGIPYINKAVDEGYLVIDSENQLFHIKMIEGEPYVEEIDLPKGLTFKYINCVDFDDKKFYAYLFSNDNELYILTQDDYELIKFPVPGIDPSKNEVRIYSDLFNYHIIEYGESSIHAYALDLHYNFVDEYKESRITLTQKKEGKVFNIICPGQISLTNQNSEFIRFYTKINKPFYWLGIGLILMVFQFLIMRRRKTKIKSNLIDLAIIGLTGIFGFLAVNIFPNKFYN